MATNWNLLRRKYKTLPENPSYEQVKDAIWAHYQPSNLQALVDELESRGDEKDKHENIVACLNAELTILEGLILEAMDKVGADSVRTVRGVTLRRDSTIDARIDPDGGRDRLRKWILEHDMQELLSVHGQTLSSMVRAYVEEGKDLPDGVDAVPRNALRKTGRASKQS